MAVLNKNLEGVVAIGTEFENNELNYPYTVFATKSLVKGSKLSLNAANSGCFSTPTKQALIHAEFKNLKRISAPNNRASSDSLLPEASWIKTLKEASTVPSPAKILSSSSDILSLEKLALEKNLIETGTKVRNLTFQFSEHFIDFS
ncbi:3024_t:CDS:2 [Diversispora eburnea]|uniref:3024_t:CDS:1 n=1 Tax=Diversispora eburnea TaxID=1213867 RepID=A0A9N8YL56_9GLOM|nr:3024_t:CDS:2 [Diversispora eburnea]